jgi:hypothetical protein
MIRPPRINKLPGAQALRCLGEAPAARQKLRLVAGALASAALLNLAHAYSPLVAWVAPMPLLLAIHGATLRGAFYAGLVCGALEAGVLWGVARADPQLLLALALLYSLNRAAFAMGAQWLWRHAQHRQPQLQSKPPPLPLSPLPSLQPQPPSPQLQPPPLQQAAIVCSPAAIAAWWSCLERLQAALPQALPTLLGDTQHHGWLLPVARLGGTYALSFALVWWAAAAVQILYCMQAVQLSSAAVQQALHGEQDAQTCSDATQDASHAMKAASSWHAAAEQGPQAMKLAKAWGTAAALAHSGKLSAQLKPVILALAATAVACALAYAATPTPCGSLRLNLLQGGLSTADYLHSQASPQTIPVDVQVYSALLAEAPAADLTVWGETAVARPWGDGSETGQAWAHKLIASTQPQAAAVPGARLLGLPRLPQPHEPHSGHLFNSAILLQSQAAPQVSDKQRLTPRLESHFQPGAAAQPLLLGAHRLGVIFCLESVVPEIGRGLAAQRASLLLVLADGSRFGGAAVGRLHAQRSTLRAVECGRSVAHAGQHGYSTVYSAQGQLLAPPAAPFTRATLSLDVPLYRGTTPFVRLGNWSLLPQLSCLAGALYARWHGRSRAARAKSPR